MARTFQNVTLGPSVAVDETANVGPGVVVAGNPTRVVKNIDELVCWPGFFERPYVWREQSRDD